MDWKYNLTNEDVEELITDIVETLATVEDIDDKTSEELEVIIRGVLCNEGWKYGLYAEIGYPFIFEATETIVNTDSFNDLSEKDKKNIIRGIAITNWA